jgi:bacterioferritin (cytochrome b1)
MSATKRNLQNYLYLLMTAGVLSACSSTKNDSTCEDNDECIESSYCINVYNEECPSMEDFENEYLPQETCDNGIVFEQVEATSEATASEIGSLVPAGDTGSTSESVSYSCCYETLAQQTEGSCMPPDVTEGRPLMCDGVAQVATIGIGRSWIEGPSPKYSQRTKEQRHVLATFWLRTAQLEHASVASFHQFGLDLMRFGASPDLLMRTSKAAMDEISHAKAAFAITEGFLGHPVSPEEFNMRLQPAKSLAEFAVNVAMEGAVNETLAVVLATLQHEKCEDYAIKKLLMDIIREEAEHAELAWDTLRWLIDVGDEEVVEALWELTQRNFVPDVSSFPGIGIPKYGVISQTIAFSALQNAYQHVVIPNLKMILEEKMVQLAVS